MPKQERLVLHLHRNYPAKWNDVFVWLLNRQNPKNDKFDLIDNKSQNKAFLKALMLAIAENVAVTLSVPPSGCSPLILAAAVNEKDSILALIKRGANVHQQNYSYSSSVLHYAADYASINACATLLENYANIDVADKDGWIPLMYAAVWREKSDQISD